MKPIDKSDRYLSYTISSFQFCKDKSEDSSILTNPWRLGSVILGDYLGVMFTSSKLLTVVDLGTIWET